MAVFKALRKMRLNQECAKWLLTSSLVCTKLFTTSCAASQARNLYLSSQQFKQHVIDKAYLSLSEEYDHPRLSRPSRRREMINLVLWHRMIQQSLEFEHPFCGAVIAVAKSTRLQSHTCSFPPFHEVHRCCIVSLSVQQIECNRNENNSDPH